MKKILLYVLSLFLLTANVLAAASLNVPDSIDFYSERGETVTQDFTIKNNGDVGLTNIVVSSDILGYNIGFSEQSDGTYTSTLNIASLAIDASKKIYVKITTPDNEEIDTQDIGNILINANGISKSITINEHIGGLEIIDVDAKIGKREEAFNDLNDGDLIKPDYTRPGEPVKFEVDIENLFSKDSENEINNIRINVAIIGISEDEEDLEEESDDIDLEPEKSHREAFEFSIPIEMEEGEYDVKIDVEGRDDHGFDREAHWTLKLEVEKESHDVKIRSASLSPTKIICSGTSILSTTIYNFGRSTEDEIKLTIKNSALGINIVEESIELDNDLFEEESRLSKSFSIPVSKSQKAGTYPIDIWVYFDKEEDVRADYRKLELVVESCPVEEKEKEEPVCGNNIVETGEECDDGNNIPGDGCSALCKTEIVKEEEEKEQITGTVITETKEEGNNWISLLVGINVLVLIIVIVLIVLLFRKKPKEGEEEVYKNF